VFADVPIAPFTAVVLTKSVAMLVDCWTLTLIAMFDSWPWIT
jgi:hypothetical protein